MKVYDYFLNQLYMRDRSNNTVALHPIIFVCFYDFKPQDAANRSDFYEIMN